MNQLVTNLAVNTLSLRLQALSTAEATLEEVEILTYQSIMKVNKDYNFLEVQQLCNTMERDRSAIELNKHSPIIRHKIG